MIYPISGQTHIKKNKKHWMVGSTLICGKMPMPILMTIPACCSALGPWVGPWALASAKKCPMHDERLIPLAHQMVKDVILIIRHMGMDQYLLIPFLGG